MNTPTFTTTLPLRTRDILPPSRDPTDKPTPLGALHNLAPEFRNKVYSLVVAEVNATTVRFTGAEMLTITSWKDPGQAKRSDGRRKPPVKDPLALARTSKPINAEMQFFIRERAHTFDVDHDPMDQRAGATFRVGIPIFPNMLLKDVRRITFTNVRFEEKRLPDHVHRMVIDAFWEWSLTLIAEGKKLPKVEFLDNDGKMFVLDSSKVSQKNWRRRPFYIQ